MKVKPLVPFFLIAVLGLLLMLSLSFIGLDQQAKIQGDGEDGAEEEVVEIDDPIEYGEGVVNQSCITCHGSDLSGQGNAPALNSLGGKYTAEEIADIAENGIGEMPPGFATGAEAEAVAEYLLSISE